MNINKALTAFLPKETAELYSVVGLEDFPKSHQLSVRNTKTRRYETLSLKTLTPQKAERLLKAGNPYIVRNKEQAAEVKDKTKAEKLQ